MKLVGQEERALWAAAAASAMPRLTRVSDTAPLSPQGRTLMLAAAANTADVTAAYADAIVLEFRERDGSRP